MTRRIMKRWLCRIVGHRPDWWYLDFGSHRGGPCLRCGRRLQQTVSAYPRERGPILIDEMPPCTHGTGGVGLPGGTCMRCAVDRQNRGLR